jgi:hypothetical protein
MTSVLRLYYYTFPYSAVSRTGDCTRKWYKRYLCRCIRELRGIYPEMVPIVRTTTTNNSTGIVPNLKVWKARVTYPETERILCVRDLRTSLLLTAEQLQTLNYCHYSIQAQRHRRGTPTTNHPARSPSLNTRNHEKQ